MSEKQEIAPSKRKLSKAFLIVGIALLLSSFFLFYLASRINFDFSTTYTDTVNLREAGSGIYPYDFGSLQHFPFRPTILMEADDYLIVSYDTPPNGTVYIVLWHYTSHPTVLKYTSSWSFGFLDYKASEQTLVKIYLASQNPDNAIPTRVVLHHYERPQWVLFGIGVVTASLAPIAVFKSKR